MAAEIKAREKAYSQQLQHDGRWPHIWRVVGEYANYSVFDVASNDELHELLQGLPLFPTWTSRSRRWPAIPRPSPEHSPNQDQIVRRQLK